MVDNDMTDRRGERIKFTNVTSNFTTIEDANGNVFIRQKKGKWIEGRYGYECSECGKRALQDFDINPFTLQREYHDVRSNFCPNCGANNMRGEKLDE